MDLVEWLVMLVALCLWQQVLALTGKKNLTQSQRLRLFVNDRSRKQGRKELLRELEWHRTLQFVHDKFPHLLNFRAQPNHYIHDPPITKRVSYVFMYQPMGGDDTIRHCLNLVSDKNKFVDSFEFTPERRLKWDFLNGTKYKSKFDLHQGHFAFGVCNNEQNYHDRHCAYGMMLREPFDRLRVLLESCRRSHSSDPWCHNATRVTAREFLLNHGSTTFRQLISTLEPCYSSSKEPCWTRQKTYYDRYIPSYQESALLNFVLENLDNWFSVVGLYEDFASSLNLFAHAYRMPFDDCTILPEDIEASAEEKEERQNSVQNSYLDSRNLALEIEGLKSDSDVLRALKPDIEIYRKATKIFRRQLQIYKNRLR